MNRVRSNFHPLQPSIDHLNANSVIYEEISPDKSLNEYIHCFWRLYTKSELENPFSYRVVSDGCIDVLYEQSDPKKIFITGFSPRYIEFDLGTCFDYAGIRFLPAGFPGIFKVSAQKLTSNFTTLGDISEVLNEGLKSSMSGLMELESLAESFNRILCRIIKNHVPEFDPRFMNALLQILESSGDISLKELDVAVSERQLRRLFEHYIGTAPKTFIKVVRFQNLLNSTPTWKSLTNEKTYYDQGYYDQAHFIKEFKAFYGVTPGKAFGQ